MVFHRSLGDTKSPQISGTLLSILAVLNNGRVAEIKWYVCMSKSQRSLCLILSDICIIIIIIISLKVFHLS